MQNRTGAGAHKYFEGRIRCCWLRLLGCVPLAGALTSWVLLSTDSGRADELRGGDAGGIVISADGTVALLESEAKPATAETAVRHNTRRSAGGPEVRRASVSLRAVATRLAAWRASAEPSAGREPPQRLGELLRVDRIRWAPGEDVWLEGPACAKHDPADGATREQRPLRVDDLVELWQALQRRDGISVSLDPDPDRLQQTDRMLRTQRFTPAELARVLPASLGPQRITFEGIAANSHAARVLLAADLRMKRLALRLDVSPVPGLPSYLELVRGARLEVPRWWLEYQGPPASRDHELRQWTLPMIAAVVQGEPANEMEAEGVPANAMFGRQAAAVQRWARLFNPNFLDLPR